MIPRENHEWDDALGMSPTPWHPPYQEAPMSDQDFPPQYHKTRAEWDRAYDDAMQWRDWQTCEILTKEREHAVWHTPHESPDRNPLSRRFHELLAEAGDLHDLKQADYGLDSDPFANVRASQAWGMPAWVGAMVRATDKVKRLQTYARKGELKSESVVDAFMDLAVYALIARVLYEEDNDPTKDTFA